MMNQLLLWVDLRWNFSCHRNIYKKACENSEITKEDAEKYCWEIKPNMLEGNLVEFLDEQFKAYTS